MSRDAFKLPEAPKQNDNDLSVLVSLLCDVSQLPFCLRFYWSDSHEDEGHPRNVEMHSADDKNYPVSVYCARTC